MYAEMLLTVAFNVVEHSLDVEWGPIGEIRASRKERFVNRGRPVQHHRVTVSNHTNNDSVSLHHPHTAAAILLLMGNAIHCLFPLLSSSKSIRHKAMITDKQKNHIVTEVGTNYLSLESAICVFSGLGFSGLT